MIEASGKRTLALAAVVAAVEWSKEELVRQVDFVLAVVDPVFQ